MIAEAECLGVAMTENGAREEIFAGRPIFRVVECRRQLTVRNSNE
jgi:hypothetical protein